MSPQTPARLHIKITIIVTCTMTVVGGLAGALLGDWGDAVVAALAAGVTTAAGSFLTRHRAMAGTEEALDNAAARGYADGLAHGVLAAVAKYEAAVFPMSPGGVTAEERFARRSAAYQLSSAGELPHPVRTSAATALAALDDHDMIAAQGAIAELFTAVHRQTTGR
jgi:hypothetical protein